MDCFIGRKGSGKSYNVVATVILPALKQGRNVVTNIPLTDLVNTDSEIKGLFYSFDIENLEADFFSKEKIIKGAIYVLDEVQKLWPAGVQVMQFSVDEKRFISESRHMVGEDGYTTDIVLVTQDSELIAKYPRNLIDKTYRCKKLDAVGMKNSYKVDVFDGPVPLNLRSQSQLINSYTGRYNKKVFDYYKSHTLNTTEYTSGLELKNKNASVLSSPIIRYGLPVSILFIAFSFYFVFGFFGNLTGGAVVDEVVKSEVVDTSFKAEQQVNPNSLVYDFSLIYRISHYYKTDNYQIVFITDNFSIYPIPFSSCAFLPVVGLNCIYSNQVVNFFSGELPIFDNQNNDSAIPSF